jgi:hypothetical protein
MVISNRDQMPGIVVRGKELPKVDRPQAGMLFYNDEGTENGGLIFGGRRNEKGEVVNSGGSLSFDKYGASQIVRIAGVDDKDNQFAGLSVDDQDKGASHRVWVGRQADGAALLSLMDGAGRKRIVMQVTEDGRASLEFLDLDGRVVQRLSPDNQELRRDSGR